MATRWARVVRGLFAALVATTAAATSHLLAGGTLAIVGLVLSATFAAIVCIALAGRTVSAGRLAASVGLSQLAFHTAFSYLGVGGTVMTMGHHDVRVTTDAASALTTDPAMWAGHALAALLTVLALRHGEAAFWRLLELVLLAVRAWRIPSPELPRARVLATGLIERPPLVLLGRAALKYRGPPAIRFA